MDQEVLFGKVLDAYRAYYNVKTEDVEAPFDAEAVFAGKQEQYFLMHSAKLAEVQSNEYVYLAKRPVLRAEELLSLCEAAWERGTAQVRPNSNHKSSDVTLLLLVPELSEEVRRAASKVKYSRTYKLGLWGFSNFRVAVIESASGEAAFNGQGKLLKPLVSEIYHTEGGK